MTKKASDIPAGFKRRKDALEASRDANPNPSTILYNGAYYGRLEDTINNEGFSLSWYVGKYNKVMSSRDLLGASDE